MTPNPPPAIRSPSQCVDACIRNLEWCASLSTKAADLAAHSKHAPEMGGVIVGLTKEADAYRQAIALLRTEFAPYLDP